MDKNWYEKSFDLNSVQDYKLIMSKTSIITTSSADITRPKYIWIMYEYMYEWYYVLHKSYVHIHLRWFFPQNNLECDDQAILYYKCLNNSIDQA